MKEEFRLVHVRLAVESARSADGLWFVGPLKTRYVEVDVLQPEVWQFSKGEGRKHPWSTTSWTASRVYLVCCCGTRETPFPMMRTLVEEQRKVWT